MDPLLCGPRDIKNNIDQNRSAQAVFDTWRVKYLARLLFERGDTFYTGGDYSVINELIEAMCTN